MLSWFTINLSFFVATFCLIGYDFCYLLITLKAPSSFLLALLHYLS